MTENSAAQNLSWWRRVGRWRLIVWGVLLVLLPIVAFWVGRRAETTAESVANAAPPPARHVVAEVVEGALNAEEVFRGLVASDTHVIAAMTTQAGVVTHAPPESGAVVVEGDVLVEIDDRPVVILYGELPLLRDVGAGGSGAVVRQLQEGLERLGFRAGAPDGVFDSETERALSDLYESIGYSLAVDVAGSALLAAAEVVFIPAGEARVLESYVARGSVLDPGGPIAVLYAGIPRVRVSARESDLPYFPTAGLVSLRTDRGEVWGSGRVVDVDRVESDGLVSWEVEIEPVEVLGPDSLGVSIQVVVGGGDESGLVVPVTAVRADASERLYVLVAAEDWSTRQVDVDVGLSVGGFVIVKGDLQVGDRVVVSD